MNIKYTFFVANSIFYIQRLSDRLRTTIYFQYIDYLSKCSQNSMRGTFLYQKSNTKAQRIYLCTYSILIFIASERTLKTIFPKESKFLHNGSFDTKLFENMQLPSVRTNPLQQVKQIPFNELNVLQFRSIYLQIPLLSKKAR